MSTALGLAMQISANTAQLATAVADVNKRLDSMGEAGKKAGDDLGTLKNIEIGKLALGGIKAVSGAFLSLSKSVLGAVESIVSFGKSVADELDNLNDVAARTGVGVEALQAYGAAAKLSGTDVETFAKSIQKLSVNIGNATDEKSAKKFTALGIAFEELKAATPTEQFEMVADALARISDPAERAAAAVKLFGKGGIELGPLFSEGPGALAKMREEAISLGQVVNEDSIKAIAAMNDAFDKVWMTVKGITGQIVGELAGPIAEIAADLLNVVKAAGPSQIASSIAQGLLDFIDLAGTSFLNLAKFIDAFVRKFSTILGIDMQSESEKELAALNKKEEGTRRTVNQGMFTSEVFTPGTLTEDEQRRRKELQQQIEAERSGTVYDVMRESLGNAVDKARAKLEERMNQPTLPQSGVAAVVADQEATAGASAEQTKVLNEIARNTRPATTVELPR
jgi:hypothetical protein